MEDVAGVQQLAEQLTLREQSYFQVPPYFNHSPLHLTA